MASSRGRSVLGGARAGLGATATGLLLAAALAVPAGGAAPAPGGVDAARLAQQLAALGPRVSGSPGHRRAATLLLAEMRRVGLSGIAAEPVAGLPGEGNLSGVLRGASDREIVLGAHYDTVPGSPGALDDASGCAVVLAAVADLARTPLDHGVRVVLFDGEERDLAGSRAWAAGLGEQGRQRVLAALMVEMVGRGEGEGGVVLTLPAAGTARERWRLAPGWLVHAALRGGETVGWRSAFLARRGSLPAQLLLRVTAPAFGGDAGALLAAGIPAMTLSDAGLGRLDLQHHRPGDTARRLDAYRLGRWSEVTAAVVRRLDHLAGRPLLEDEYLVVGRRVWLRRDLYWLGFALWAALVVRAFRQRQRTGATPPGSLAFRFLFLAATLVAPALATPLLLPAAGMALWSPRRRRWRWLGMALGLAPAVALAAGAALAAARGQVLAWSLGAVPSLVLAAALAVFARYLLAAPPPPAPAAE